MITWQPGPSKAFADGLCRVETGLYEGYPIRRCYTKMRGEKRSTMQYYVLSDQLTPRELMLPFRSETALCDAIDHNLKQRYASVA